MTLKDVSFTLEINGVIDTDIEYIVDFCRDNGFEVERVDDELVKLGYERIFENELEDEWDDDDYGHIEKFPHKHSFAEDYN